MPKHCDGFALITFTLIVLIVSSSICASIANRLMHETQVITNQKRYVQISQQVENNLARQLAKVYAQKSTLSTYELDTAEAKYTVTTHFVATPNSLKYEGVYNLVAIGSRLNAHNELARQAVSVGSTKLVKNAPTQAMTQDGLQNISSMLTPLTTASLDLLILLEKFANHHLTTCDNLTHHTIGIIWVSGRCKLDINSLGSINRPVILMVQEGDIEISSQTQFYGLIVHACDDMALSKKTLYTQNGAKINGALISTCNTSLSMGTLVYSAHVLDNWIAHPDNTHLEVINGSWVHN